MLEVVGFYLLLIRITGIHCFGVTNLRKKGVGVESMGKIRIDANVMNMVTALVTVMVLVRVGVRARVRVGIVVGFMSRIEIKIRIMVTVRVGNNDFDAEVLEN